jgi:hypothetical protein
MNWLHWPGYAAIVLIALILAWWPAGAVVRRALAAVDLSEGTEALSQPGLGRWIGRFERSLIVLLLIADAPTAVGLVVTAKSILRFPEITGDEPAIRPEYVLVGSLASWAIGVGIGFVANVLVGQLP